MLWPKIESHKATIAQAALYSAANYCFMSPFGHEKHTLKEAPFMSQARHIMITGNMTLCLGIWWPSLSEGLGACGSVS